MRITRNRIRLIEMPMTVSLQMANHGHSFKTSKSMRSAKNYEDVGYEPTIFAYFPCWQEHCKPETALFKEMNSFG